jgi:hypothetical protein
MSTFSLDQGPRKGQALDLAKIRDGDSIRCTYRYAPGNYSALLGGMGGLQQWMPSSGYFDEEEYMYFDGSFSGGDSEVSDSSGDDGR